MESYTALSAGLRTAVVNALPDHYDMSLNPQDMAVLVQALMAYVEASPDPDGEESAERAESLLSGIGETLGVEGV